MKKNYPTGMPCPSPKKAVLTNRWFSKTKNAVLLLGFVAGFTAKANAGVRTYANAYRGTASSASSAINAPYTDYATVSVSGGLFGGSTDFFLIQPSNVSANATIFVKVDASDNVALTAYKNTTTTSDGTAASGSTSVVTTAQDGSVYFAVSATEAFNAVKITVSAGTFGTSSTQVYFAFNDVGNTTCSAISTSPVNAGASIFNLLVPTVVNSLNAIDNSISTYSQLSPAIVSAGSLSQTIYLSGLSQPGDAATVTYSVPPSLISVGLGYTVTLSAYNGSTLVDSKNLANLITLNILGIFNNSQPLTLSFVPKNVFDRLVVTLSFGVQIGSDGVYVYDVSRTTAPPAVGANDTVRVTKGATAVLTATSTYSTDVISWYNTPSLTGSLLGTGKTFTTGPINDTTRYYVSASNTGCNSQSQRSLIVVIPSAAVLPAVGLNLGGTVIAGKAVLNWSTLQEQNTSYFDVEASSDGSTFNSIGKVSAAGNSSSTSSYSFTDASSSTGLVYYRVKLVDLDGQSSFSNVFSLRLSGNAIAKVYPNPATNLVTIEIGAAGNYVAELFTVDGKKLSSTTLSTTSGSVNLTLDRTNITSGMYLLKVTNKSTATSTYNTLMVK